MQPQRSQDEEKQNRSSSPRFSRTFDKLVYQFSEGNDQNKRAVNMASNNAGYQSSTWNEQCPYKPTPWKLTVSSPTCAFCNKAVFPAEEVTAAGQKFHKLCLKCLTCNTLLNTGNVNEHEKKIYCVGCYRRQFGPHGVGRGLGTTPAGSSLETPPISPNASINEINGHIELSNSELINTKRSSSLCSSQSGTSSNEDSRPSNSSMNGVTYIGGVTTSRTSFNIPRPPTISLANGGASFKFSTIGGNVCPRCSKNVYSAEEVKAAGKSFHRQCYTCAHCNKSINAGRYSEHEGELYDNNCYQRLFGPKGVGFGIGSGTLSTGT